MGALEIPHRLLGRETVVPVRLDRVAQFGQRGLGGQNQMRPIDVRIPAQEIGDRIGRGSLGRFCRPRGRKSDRGRRGRSLTLGAWGLWNGRRGRRLGRRGEGRHKRSEERRGTALVLKKKRVDADAHQTDRKTRTEIKGQMLGLEPPSQPLPQRLAVGMLQRSPERAEPGRMRERTKANFFSSDRGSVSPVRNSKGRDIRHETRPPELDGKRFP